MSLEILLVLLLTILVYLFMTTIIWLSLRSNTFSAWLMKPILVYIGVAYVLKTLHTYAFGWHVLHEAGGISLLPNRSQEFDIAMSNLSYILATLLGMTTAIFMIPKTRTIAVEKNVDVIYEIPSGWFLLFYALIALKLAVAYLFDWGIPGVTPVFNISNVTGLVNILSKDGLTAVFMIICFLFTDPNVRRRTNYITFPLIVFCYIGSDLFLGWKSGLVFGIVGFIFVMLSAAHQRGKGYFNVGIVVVSVGLVFPSIYLFTNIFRFIRLDESLSLLDAVISTMAYIEQKAGVLAFSEVSSAMVFFMRITGIEGIASAVMIGDFDFSFFDLMFQTGISQRYTEAVTGVGDGSFAVGGTILGSVYLMCDGNNFCIFSVIYVIDTVLFLMLLFASVLVSKVSSISFGTSFAISLVVIHMQLATGALIDFIVRVFVIFGIAFSMYLISKKSINRFVG